MMEFPCNFNELIGPQLFCNVVSKGIIPVCDQQNMCLYKNAFNGKEICICSIRIVSAYSENETMMIPKPAGEITHLTGDESLDLLSRQA